MGAGEIITLSLALVTIGTAIIGALVRTIFSGIRSRIDRLEEKVDSCMQEMIRLAREGKHG